MDNELGFLRRLVVIFGTLVALAHGGGDTPDQPSGEMTTTTSTSAPAKGSLVGADDLRHIGSFATPAEVIDEDYSTESSLAWGGYGLAFNPANNSLFVTGHAHHQRTAEIAIPASLGTSDPQQLPQATLISEPVDATHGKLRTITNPPDDEYGTIGGYLVIGDELVISAYDYYDASDDQVSSHFLADTSLRGVTDPVALTEGTKPRWLGGAMTTIPAQWQASFGGDSFLTGLSGISIASNSSVGPSAASFSRSALLGEGEATQLVGYPIDAPLDAPEEQSELWNLTSQVRGMVFPDGTDSLLFIGTHGTGPYCYGTGEACGDDELPPQGTHAAPYRFQVWAYDASDLATVYRRELAPEAVEPYDVWELELPADSPVHEITGVAYDPTTGRIFIGQAHADGDLPLIHVYEV